MSKVIKNNDASHALDLIGKKQIISAEIEGIVIELDCELKSKDGLTYFFDMSLSKDCIEKTIERYVTERYRSEQPVIDGFVRGKVPYSVIKRYYAKLFEKSTNSQIQKLEEYVLISNLHKYIGLLSKHYHLDFVSEPKYTKVGEISSEVDFECSFSIDISPHIPDIQLSEININHYIVSVSDEDIDRYIEEWCNTNYKGVDLIISRPAQKWDIISADITVKGNSDVMNDVTILIGGGKFVKEFEESFIGKNIGDEFVQILTIPESFSDKKIAGSSIQAKINVKNIRASEKHKPGDEMAKIFGVSTMLACREKIHQLLLKEYNNTAKFVSRRDMLRRISEKMDIEIPYSVMDNLIFQNVNELAKRIGVVLEYPLSDNQKEEIKPLMEKNFGMDYDKWLEHINPDVTAEAKGRMFMLKYSKDHDIQVTKAELDQAVAERSMNFPGGLKDAIEYYQHDANAKQFLINQIYENKLMDDIFLHVTKKDNSINTQQLFELMGVMPKEKVKIDDMHAKDLEKSKKAKKDKAEDNDIVQTKKTIAKKSGSAAKTIK